MRRVDLALFSLAPFLATPLLAATISVNSLDDNSGCSLRSAISAANQNQVIAGCSAGAPGVDTIDVAVNGTYAPATELPAITEPVILQAPLFSFTLNGQFAGNGTAGLTLAEGSSGSSIHGLIIVNFGASGIVVESDANEIYGNRIGTDGDTYVAGNCRSGAGAGVLVRAAAGKSASRNFIGRNSAGVGGDRNVISGNGCSGVRIATDGGGLADENVVSGNFIGTDYCGCDPMPNEGYGISIVGASGTEIGHPNGPHTETPACSFSPCNVISANTQGQVYARLPTSALRTTMTANIVGGNYTETMRLAGGSPAPGAPAVDIGGGGWFRISDNAVLGATGAGIRVIDSSPDSMQSNAIDSNRIGCGFNGHAVPNEEGILVVDSSSLTIDSNHLCANRGEGVGLRGAMNVRVSGNAIGTGRGKVSTLPNKGGGIVVGPSEARPSSNNTIGSSPQFGDQNLGNVIAWNTADGHGAGVVISGGTSNRVSRNQIAGNVGSLSSGPIDLDADGRTANDECDADSGTNHLQNHPVMRTAVRPRGLKWYVCNPVSLIGALNALPSQQHAIEFFSGASDAPDMVRYLQTLAVTTGADCNTSFDVLLPFDCDTLPTGARITATATSADGSTSEASIPVTIVPGQQDPKADFSGFLDEDIVLRNRQTGQNAAWFMNRTNLAVIADFPGLTDAAYAIVGTADFDDDGYVDLLWRNDATGANAVWMMNGGALREVVDIASLPSAWRIEGTGDFDVDGMPDIILRNIMTGANALWLMNKTTVRQIVDLPPLPNNAYRIESSADFNGDGSADLLWRNYGSGANALWLMNGVQLGSVVDLPALPNTSYRIDATGDFDEDGKSDIVWRNYATGANALWLMDRLSVRQIVDLPALQNSAWEIVGPR